MVEKKPTKEETDSLVKHLILEILELEGRDMNIRQIKVKLEKDYNIIRSSQTIKKYVEKLAKEGKITIDE